MNTHSLICLIQTTLQLFYSNKVVIEILHWFWNNLEPLPVLSTSHDKLSLFTDNIRGDNSHQTKILQDYTS